MGEEPDTAIRAIVLDFNGTLAQDDHLVAPLYVDTFASVGVPLTVEECHRELAALPDRDVFDLAIRRAGLPPEAGHRDALVRARVEGYLAAVADDPPIEPQEVVAVEDATGGAQAARAAGMRVAAIRGLGYDPASGYADVIIDRLDLPALELILALGTGQRRS